MKADQKQVYKRYSTHIKRDNASVIKQNKIVSNQNLQDQNENQPSNSASSFKDNIIFQSIEQKKLEPIILKRFQEYFRKSIEQNKNIRIFDQFMQHQTIKSDKKRRNQKIFSYSLTNNSSLLQNDNILGRKKFTTERRKSNYSSISKYQLTIPKVDEKVNSLIFDQNFTDPCLSDVKLKPLNFIGGKNGKRSILHQSINLSKVLNRTTFQCDRKPDHQFSTLVSQTEEVNVQNQDYLRIESSILVDRKTITSLPKSPQTIKNFNKQDLKKSIRKKIQNRSQAFEQVYREQVRSRSPSPSKTSKKVNFLDFINPSRKKQFTLIDLIKVSLVNSMIDEVKFNLNGCFFSVYVQEGNNSQLIKSLVRGTNGWRVSELIEVSNLVWTQNYRKNLIDKKPKKIFKHSIPQDDQNVKSKQKNRNDFKDKEDFLLSRIYLRKNSGSGSNKSIKRKSLQQIPDLKLKSKMSEDISGKNYPELSLSKYKTQFQQFSYQKQLRKLLPASFMFQNFVLRSEKQAKKIEINPNLLIHNHLIGHRSISDKKNLLFNLRKFYFNQRANPFQFIPQSHDIFVDDNENEFLSKQNQSFLHNNQQSQIMKKQIWIVKPGEDSNRGRGIVICKGWQSVMTEISKRFKQNKSKKRNDQNEIKQITDKQLQIHGTNNSQNKNPHKRSIILQRYITPLLYQGRKFDIRSYMLVTWVNNVMNGYFYEQCYIRTSSKQFDIESQNKYVHLTNDAVQTLSHDYGKYQEGNKVSEMAFQKYFQSLPNQTNKSWEDIKIEMSQRSKQIIKSSSKKLVGRFGNGTQNSVKQSHEFSAESSGLLKMRETTRSQKSRQGKGSFLFPLNDVQKQEISFQLFGLDFMIDQNLKLWLIEVNTNPAITHDCSRVLNRLIPKLLDNTFAIAVMPFMRPSKVPENLQYQNRYHHIYQEKINP